MRAGAKLKYRRAAQFHKRVVTSQPKSASSSIVLPSSLTLAPPEATFRLLTAAERSTPLSSPTSPNASVQALINMNTPPSRSRAMMGGWGVSDGYEGSKRPRMMMESNPYFAANAGTPLDVSKRARMMEPGPPYFGGMGSSAGAGSGGFYQPFGGNLPGAGVGTGMQSFPSVRLRGLPFDCNEIDICKFFVGLDIVDCLLVHKNGRFSGEAYVVFATSMQAELALHRNRQNMGRRYVEVFRCKKQEYYSAVASEVNQGGFFDSEYRHSPPPPRSKKPVEDKSSMEYTEVLKLRGLPYSATVEDIIKFFVEYELTEENVHIGYRPDGKATGEAFVEFPTAEVAKTAMCKDKMTIGTRYVELFPSTQEEANRAKSRGRQ